VLGNYESTAWTRCTTSTTRLAPQTGRGVVFPPAISSQTVLDGFAIDRFAADTAIGVSVDGARNVMLSNLVIVGSPAVTTTYGVNVTNAGDAVVFRSYVGGGVPANNAVGVRSVGSRVAVEDSCSVAVDPTTGVCPSDCGGGISTSYTGSAELEVLLRNTQYAVVLDDSPGSRIERSTVCSTQGRNGAFATGSPILVSGDASNVLIRGNGIQSKAEPIYYGSHRSAVRFLACKAANPWLVGNRSITAKLELGLAAVPQQAQGVDAVIVATGDCHPVIEANASIEGSTVGGTMNYGTGVRCATEDAASSRCVVTSNSITGNRPTDFYSSNSSVGGSGISCWGGSCARIDHNRVVGLVQAGTFAYPFAGPFISGTGISVTGSTLISDNEVTGVCAHNNRVNAVGISLAASNGLLENNEIVGLCALPPNWNEARGVWGLSVDSAPGNEWLVRRNDIHALPGSPCGANYCQTMAPLPSFGVNFTGTAGVFQENLISPGQCGDGVAFYEGTVATRHPRVFESNELAAETRPTFPVWQGALYQDGAAGKLLTPQAVDALTDMTASGTTLELCPAP
jgi:hypothetical protein